jgi:chemotaxis protein histidine kinase CheA
MRSSPHLILVLATIIGLVTSNPPARNARQLEEGSGDESVDTHMTEPAPTEDQSKVKISQGSESEISSTENQLSENEVKVDLPTEDEKLAEAEKKDDAKCKKCLKPTWRGRHASICKSCEIKGVIKPIDKKDENQVEKCKKCVRRKFKARHAIFCDECPAPDLYEEDQNVKSEHKKNKKKTSLIKSMSEQENEKDQKAEEESKDKRKHEHKNKTKKNGDTNKSNKKDKTEQNEKVKTKHQLKNKNHKNKNKKNKNVKNKHKNKINDQTKENSSDIKFATTDMDVEKNIELEPTKTNLGPLGSLIKYLVKSNTFTK